MNPKKREYKIPTISKIEFMDCDYLGKVLHSAGHGAWGLEVTRAQLSRLCLLLGVSSSSVASAADCVAAT